MCMTFTFLATTRPPLTHNILHPSSCNTCIVLCISVLELEAIAAEPPPSKQFVMSPSEAKFIAYLITRHGNNYKVSTSTEYRLVEDTLLCIVLFLNCMLYRKWSEIKRIITSWQKDSWRKSAFISTSPRMCICWTRMTKSLCVFFVSAVNLTTRSLRRICTL